MDPITGAAVVGVGYLLVRRADAVPPDESQPESVGNKKQQGAKGQLPRMAAGGGLGGMLGALTGEALANVYLDVTKGYDAPVAKEIGKSTIIATSAVGGALVVAVAIGYGALAAGYVGIVVIAVLIIVFSVFVLAANVEDVNRWNNYVSRKQIIVKMVAAGLYKQAMLMANEGAKQGVPSLGFYLDPNYGTVYYKDSLYFKTAFDASPKVPSYNAAGKVVGYQGRGGLDQNYYYPGIVAYEYDTYFGVDGAHIGTRNDGTQINYITFLKGLYAMQKAAYDALKKQLGRTPTYGEWIASADTTTDQDGHTLREWIGLHDAFGKQIQPNVPWLDIWLLQSPRFEFKFDPNGINPPSKGTDGRVVADQYNVGGGYSNIP